MTKSIDNTSFKCCQCNVVCCGVMCYINGSDFDDYCGKCVYSLGRDAEGPLVNKGVLFQCLECEGSIVFLDRKDTPLSEIFMDSKASFAITNVCILLQPGHFDLLYCKSDVAAAIELPADKFVTKEIQPIKINVDSQEHLIPSIDDLQSERVRVHRQFIAEQILTARCPNVRCRAAFFDFDDPVAMDKQCLECKTRFCGWCLMKFEYSAASHARTCSRSLNMYSLFGTQVLFNKCHCANRTTEITGYISDKVLLDDRTTLITELRFDLEALGIQLTD